jgi:hypothetical protein
MLPWLDNGYENIRLINMLTCWLSRPQFMERMSGRTFNWRDCKVGRYLSQQSHHAGVVCSGHKLCSNTSQKLYSTLPRTQGISQYTQNSIQHTIQSIHTVSSNYMSPCQFITQIHKSIWMAPLYNAYCLFNMPPIKMQDVTGRCSSAANSSYLRQWKCSIVTIREACHGQMFAAISC